ncbi:exodeoxyribonuclease III [Rhizobium leguminosarum]
MLRLPGGIVKIATYNVNGINGRLQILLRWLKEDAPDVVCLQELKTDDAGFPRKEIERAGYGAVWHGQRSWNGVAILAKGKTPILTRRGLPGDPDDTHSRYIEAVVDGILIGCLYLPNGNPFPGAKIDYKLRWFRRLHEYAIELLDIGVPSILAGDFNVMPTGDRRIQAGTLAGRCPFQAGSAQGLCSSRRPRLDRRRQTFASRGADLHLLEILAKQLRT